MAGAGWNGSVVVGVPIDSLGRPGGTESAPRALREAGVVDALGARDAGDLPVRIVGEARDPASGIVGYETVVAASEGIRDGLASVVEGCSARPVVLGGCCTLVPAAIAALARSDRSPIGLAYLDGHMDTYDPRTSPTGEAADLPVATCVGLGDERLTSLGPDRPLVAPGAVALLAHRDRAEAEGHGAAMPEDLGIAHSLDAGQVRAAGPGRAGDAAAKALADGPGRWWLAIDVDVLSTGSFPATPAQQPGGLDVDELVELARPLAAHPGCAGLSIQCYDPDLDDARHSGAATVAEILRRTTAPDRGRVTSRTRPRATPGSPSP